MLPAARKRLGAKKLFCFGFEALVMNRLRCRVRRAHLPRDLFAERHAGNEARSLAQARKGRPLGRPGRAEPSPNTGEPSAGDQSVARGVGGIVAFHFANIFDAMIVAHQQRQAFDQLRAILGDDPGIGLEHLIHQLPAADAVVIGRRRPRQAIRDQHVAELLGDKGGPSPVKSRKELMIYLHDSFAAIRKSLGAIDAKNMFDPIEGPYAGPNTRLGLATCA